MDWSANAAHHQQDKNYYCGAATAQMILHSIGAGLIGQDTLYTRGHSHNSMNGWFIDPDGLAHTLNHFAPSGSTKGFTAYAEGTQSAGTERIVHALYAHHVAAAALVYSSGHWIVVNAVATNVEPAPGTTYTVRGFYVHDPFPESPSFFAPALVPPPLHSAADGCGSGHPPGIPYSRGIAAEYVSHFRWRYGYFVGCSLWPHGDYVSVCDPEEEPDMGKLNAREEEPWATGDELISPDQAIEYALTGIDVHELRENERFGKALEGADPVTPILVERLDEAGVFYYLVPMAREEALTSVFSVHGRYGNFEGGQAFEVEADRSFFDLDQVIERILKTAIEVDPDRYPDQIKVLAAIEAGDFDLQPVRVWKPCLESRSPYYPFSVITIGDSTFYVGYNGVIYSELHDFGPGG